jgi:hypothetical protein
MKIYGIYGVFGERVKLWNLWSRYFTVQTGKEVGKTTCRMVKGSYSADVIIELDKGTDLVSAALVTALFSEA